MQILSLTPQISQIGEKKKEVFEHDKDDKDQHCEYERDRHFTR